PELVQLMGRFRGLFGNPNGLGIFCVLGVMLMGSLVGVKRDLFSWLERLIIYGVIIFCLIRCGSRASLVAVMIYFTIVRFFSYSPFLGFLVLVAAIGVIEVVSSNLGAII